MAIQPDNGRSDLADPAPTLGICEITLQTADPAALECFYRVALGLRVLSREDDRVWLACGPRARLGLWTPGPKEFGDRGGRHVHFALSATRGRLDGLAERLRRLSIAHRGPVEHDGGDRSLYVEDPEGNVAEVWEFFEQGEGAARGVEALA
jgi:catechol-2,3-dioxygenase